MCWSLRLAACGMCALLAGTALAQQIGEEAPELLVPKSERGGKDAISIFDLYPNRILVLYYFSTFNSQSVDFLETLKDLDEKYGPRGVTFVGLTRQKKELFEKVLSERGYGVMFPIIYGSGLGQQQVWRFPTPGMTYIIDTHRRIAYGRFDATDARENLEEKIQAVLARTPTLTATEEVQARNTQKLVDYIAQGDFGRAYTLAKGFKDIFRDKEDADQEEQAAEYLRQISLGAQKQLESARDDLKAEKYDDAARKLAELSVRLTGLEEDKDQRGHHRRSTRSSRRSRGRRGSSQRQVERARDFRDIKEDVELEIGRMESDNYSKAIVLKALDNARGEVRNDQAAECMEVGQYSEARRLYRSVLEDFAETAAAQAAQEALDRIENDPEMKKAIAKAEATEQAERWYELGDRFAQFDMFDKSRAYFEKVIKEYPSSTAAEDARDRLVHLGEDEQAARDGRQRRETATPAKDDSKTVEQARAILQKLIDGDYKGFIEAGDEKVRQALTEQQARKIWTGLESKLGKYESVGEGKVTPGGIKFPVHFERGTQTLRIVVDDQGRMSGFWVD
jgi:tetratricopeptide (TPR) repeat protein